MVLVGWVDARDNLIQRFELRLIREVLLKTLRSYPLQCSTRYERNVYYMYMYLPYSSSFVSLVDSIHCK